jgi:predicted nucleic acid-binding Zn ribbon protein
MPTYEFQCEKCRKRFELTYTIIEYERQGKKKTRSKCEYKSPQISPRSENIEES